MKLTKKIKSRLRRRVVSREKLTQQQIDGNGGHRRGFAFSLTQLRAAVFPSTQFVK